jgi:hypothetical protein
MKSTDDRQATSTEGADMYLDTIISRNSGGGGPLLFATGIALAVTALVGVSEPAFAQGNDAEAMDEIIVTTARRREESNR